MPAEVYVAKNLFSAQECLDYSAHFKALRASATYAGDESGDVQNSQPRMLNMHRWDKKAEDFLFDQRITEIIWSLLGEYLALQTMVYFKPGGSLGQAWHQDSYYFKLKSMAAWLALDDATTDNGCLNIVPGQFDMLPVIEADPTESFTDIMADVDVSKAYPLELKRGDVAFFDGYVVHGSGKSNSSSSRGALISHYCSVDERSIAAGYNPLLTADKREINLIELS